LEWLTLKPVRRYLRRSPKTATPGGA